MAVKKIKLTSKKVIGIICIALILLIGLAIVLVKTYRHSLNIPGQVTVEALQVPTPMLAMNKAYLVYELYLTNFHLEPITLTSLEVGSSNKDYQFKFTHQKLADLIHPIGKKYPEANPLLFEPGTSKMVFMWLPFDSQSAIPEQLTHKITFNTRSQNQNMTFSLAAIPLLIKKDAPVVISAPLRGDYWLAMNGPSNTSLHRAANTVINGHDYFAQRYAIDFVQVNLDGVSFHGDEHQNSSYYCYGKDVLAVAAGKIVAVRNDILENTPHTEKRAVPIDLDTVGGNYVVMDIGNGKYVFYAHMIPGSVKVKIGDTVTRGQLLGQVGNSGNSSEPHLHIHVVDGPSFLAANGIPYAFDSFDVRPKLDHYTNQLVLENTLVKFSSK